MVPGVAQLPETGRPKPRVRSGGGHGEHHGARHGRGRVRPRIGRSGYRRIRTDPTAALDAFRILGVRRQLVRPREEVTVMTCRSSSRICSGSPESPPRRWPTRSPRCAWTAWSSTSSGWRDAAHRRRGDRRGRGDRQTARSLPEVSGDPYLDPRSGVFRNRWVSRTGRSWRRGKADRGNARGPVQASAPPGTNTTSSTCASSTGRSSRTSTRGPGNCAPCSSSRPGRRSACRTRSSTPPRTSSVASPTAHHLRGRDRDGFLDGLTALLAEVNALHPFREGNGRAQRSFLSQLARDAGYRLRWEHVDRDANIDAARAAADGDLAPMRALLEPVVEAVRPRQRR